MDENASPDIARRIEITGDLDHHAAEALRLEIRRLARRYGIEIKALRVEKSADKVEEEAES